MKQTKECCNKCRCNFDTFLNHGCHNRQCKCHSPKNTEQVDSEQVSKGQAVGKTTKGGEVSEDLKRQTSLNVNISPSSFHVDEFLYPYKGISKEAKKVDDYLEKMNPLSPSSFEKWLDLHFKIHKYNESQIREVIFDLHKEFIHKSIVERDYVKKEVHEKIIKEINDSNNKVLFANMEGTIEKQKVKDAIETYKGIQPNWFIFKEIIDKYCLDKSEVRKALDEYFIKPNCKAELILKKRLRL